MKATIKTVKALKQSVIVEFVYHGYTGSFKERFEELCHWYDNIYITPESTEIRIKGNYVDIYTLI